MQEQLSGVEFPVEFERKTIKSGTPWRRVVEFGPVVPALFFLGEVDMAWHVGITWHNVWGLMLSLTLPGHYWLTLMDHALPTHAGLPSTMR